MIKPGIYSMQDFHLFRLHQFDKCREMLQIPCRWAPDAGLGYGEPIFNFYGQFVYLLGDIFHVVGFSLIDSIKMLFILSLVLSAASMYFLAKKLWNNSLSGVAASLLYIYAPYRAVDVWVRGALPEAFAFVFFPLIILSVEKKNLFYFSLFSFFLVITHNLSFLMFLPVLLIWIFYRKWWKAFVGFTITAALSAFYVLPVIFESKFVGLDSTTQGYFDFRAHFVTIKQIFFDMNWGYGGSTWGMEDGLNLSVGLIQWLLPALLLVVIIASRKLSKQYLHLYILCFMALFYLFLTHNKSTLIWETLPFMKYIQFPWRFLGIAVFCLSLASGVLFGLVKNKKFMALILIGVSFLLIRSLSFFRPDIWYNISDSYFLTGEEWDRQRTASIGDYWPKFGHQIPQEPSSGEFINYFPGWTSQKESVNGLIPAKGSKFSDTPIRRIGNIISLAALIMFIWKAKRIQSYS